MNILSTEILSLNIADFQFNFDILLLIILLILSGLISGSEVALFSLSKSDIKSKSDLKSFIIVDKLLNQPNKLLATILITNNLINIGIVILFTKIGEFLFSSIQLFLKKKIQMTLTQKEKFYIKFYLI